MARKTKAQALETRKHLLDVAIILFSQHGVSATSLADIAKAAGVTRGAIYWHFKNKSELFNEIWKLTESSISDLEVEYQAKYPDDPLSVVRELLIYILQATVSEERRRLMTEIIFHKCEFVGELAVLREARRILYMEGNERIEASLQRCIDGGYLPVNLSLSHAVTIMRSYITGLIENWLVAPDSFDLHKNAADYVAILLEMFLFCPTLQQKKKSAETQP